MTWPAALFVGLYLVVSVLLFIYGVHAFLMTGLYHRRRHDRGVETGPSRAAPFVTVQLPVYNEIYVVRRLIDAVSRFDYPRDRFEIQLLDDSTDDTVLAVTALLEEKRREGFLVAHVRRNHRNGFKGGALREGLASARGDLVAVFDADFEPPSDFLARTVPCFSDPRVGMVQTRWGHLNSDYSLLTRVQAMALDGHFLVEQTARNRNGAFINFNGTAGIWRRQAIEEAGNWQDDTLTEDLDLSYRAQLRGWTFVFLPDVVCPAELPVEINGFKGQQFRWAKGSVQTARKLLPGILRSGNGAFTKFQAIVHLTNHAVYPLLLLVALMSVPALLVHHRVPASRELFGWLTGLLLASFGHPVLYLYSQSQLRRDWNRQVFLVPVMIAVGMGLSVTNVRAILEALGGIPSGFNRTPKYDLRRPADGWRGKRYLAPGTGLSIAELLLGLYMTGATLLSLALGQYLVTPFLLLYASGFLYIAGLSIRHARPRRLARFERAVAA